MLEVPSGKLQKEFGDYSHQVVSAKEIVIITSHGRKTMVLLPYDEYRRLRSRDRVVGRTADLPPELVAEIAKTQMDPRHAHLDVELLDEA